MKPLKACPFCGGDAVIHTSDDPVRVYQRAAVICCARCLSQGPEIYAANKGEAVEEGITAAFEAIVEVAADGWNRRAGME
jgi:hypothetical protein